MGSQGVMCAEEAGKPGLRGLSGVWPSLDLWTAEFSLPCSELHFRRQPGNGVPGRESCKGRKAGVSGPQGKGQMSWGREELHRGLNGEAGTQVSGKLGS